MAANRPGRRQSGITPPDAGKHSNQNIRSCASYVEELAFDPWSPGHALYEVGNSFQPLPPGAVPQRLGEWETVSMFPMAH
eukprot:1736408-Pyramimonas_sp.AAC.1